MPCTILHPQQIRFAVKLKFALEVALGNTFMQELPLLFIGVAVFSASDR